MSSTPDKSDSRIHVDNTESTSSLASIQEKSSTWARFKDSFKPSEVVVNSDSQSNGDLEDATAKGDLLRKLKGKHIQMIAIGGSIGTGLFVGSGSALRTGGPAALLIGWGLVGTMVFCVIHALGELCVQYPVNGAFSQYATRFVDESWGFAVGWNYALMWLVVFPLELVAASMCVKYYNNTIDPVAWVILFYLFIVGINLFGVKGYGETEFILSIIKVIAIIGFIILGIVLVCGGGPNHEFIGGKNFHHPGAFSNGFQGVASVFVTAAYSLAGSEMVGLASAEVKNPRKVLPKAIRQVFWRLFLFYFLSLMLVGLIVPYNSPDLLGASTDMSISPFVVAMRLGGIKVLPAIFNACILISVVSVGNSAVYGCSRTIQSLGAQGLGPKWMAYVDKKGRPLGGIALSALFGLLCFLSGYENEGLVFAWLLSVCGLATIFTWFNISLCHVRYRLALKTQGRSLEEVTYQAFGGIYASIYSMGFLFVVLALVFYVSLFPPGNHNKADVTSFFQNYLAVIFLIVFYLGHKIITRNWKIFKDLKDVDLDSGRRIVDIDILIQEEKEEEDANKLIPLYKKIWNYLV
ncbi:general amino acid permease [Scheffersomyces amazonensis]|uniref:general amino acid permease n=1 Tax=Scheffersomyces amazonensis TaxID=1078765 RepID=UPI00315D74DB